MKKTNKIILAIALVTVLFSPVAFFSFKAFADENNAAVSLEKSESTDKSGEQGGTEKAEVEKPEAEASKTEENTEVATPEQPATDEKAATEQNEPQAPTEQPTDKEQPQTKGGVDLNQKGYVVVNYVDENGKNIVTSESHTDDVGKPYLFKAKVIPGYEFSATALGNTFERTGLYAYEQKIENFVYKKLDGYQGVHVTFDANGGVGSVAPISVSAGEQLVFPSSDGLTREGYSFIGWNAKADGSDTMYQAGGTIQLPDSYSNSNNPAIQDLTYFAIWAKTSEGDVTPEPPVTPDPEEHNYVGYSISFDANTGVGTVPASFNKKFGDKFVMPGADNLSKPGHHFVAWNDAVDGSGKSYPAGANITVVSPGNYNSATPVSYTAKSVSYAVKTAYALPEEYAPVTLYAQWAPGEAPVATQPNKQVTMGQQNVVAQNKQQLPATGENNQSYFLVIGLVTVIVSAGVFAIQYKVKKA